MTIKSKSRVLFSPEVQAGLHFELTFNKCCKVLALSVIFKNSYNVIGGC